MEEEWVGGLRGERTCHQCLAVLQRGALQNCHPEPKLHLARGGQGRENERWRREGEKEGTNERGLWRDAEREWRV